MSTKENGKKDIKLLVPPSMMRADRLGSDCAPLLPNAKVLKLVFFKGCILLVFDSQETK